MKSKTLLFICLLVGAAFAQEPTIPPHSAAHPVRQVLPPANPAGVILYKDVQVQIQVSVDERGRVIAARPLTGPEKTSQQLLGVSLAAAAQWHFQPATLRGRPVASEYTVVFEFHPKT
jgi:Gram-negative bacterial TonB protein C-terminal